MASKNKFRAPDTRDARVVIYQGEIEYISACALDFPECETGGDLFGFWTHSGNPVIHYVIGPGPQARRTAVAFYQDREYLKEMGRILRDKHGLQHIGEWHSHHQLGLAEPSGGDANTIHKAIEHYGLYQFSLLICTLEPNAPRERADADRQECDAPVTTSALPRQARPPLTCIEDGAGDDAQLVCHAHGFIFHGDRGAPFDRCPFVVLGGASPIRERLNASSLPIYHPATVSPEWQAEPRATLDQWILRETRPTFAPESWVGTRGGQALLRDLVAWLGEQAKDVRIFQESDGRISLTWSLRGCPYKLRLPDDLTQSTATLECLDGGAERCKQERTLAEYFVAQLQDWVKFRAIECKIGETIELVDELITNPTHATQVY